MRSQDSTLLLPSTDERLEKDRQDMLRTPGLLARYPLIGLAMFLLGGAAFGVIAFNLQTGGPLIQADLPLANAIHGVALRSSPILRGVMIFGFYLGEQVIVGIGAVLDLYYIYKRCWPELCMVVTAWTGEGIIWYSFSGYFNRPRPVFEADVWHHLNVPGFPSGHTISAVMCFGLICYLLAPKIRSHLRRAALIAATLLVIFFIGFSRLFVGDHYLSDVLAGFALGIAWSGCAYSVVELIFKKRINRYVQEK